MKDLIAKLEAATEGSRELDAWIHWVTLPQPRAFLDEEIHEWLEHYDGDAGAVIFGRLSLFGEDSPHYTTSLDAALTLVEPGWLWAIQRGLQCEAAVWTLASDFEGRGYSVDKPALALCTAALQARAQ